VRCLLREAAVTDTPNTSRPSEATIKTFDFDDDGEFGPFTYGGQYVLYDDHLAALARAREDARREALEEAAHRCDGLAQRAVGSRELEAKFQSENGYTNRPLLAMFTDQNEAFTEAASEIRALLAPTPQGETKEQPHA
jgi:hypothetical protein